MKPNERCAPSVSPCVVVLTDDDALWNGLLEEARDQLVQLERNSRTDPLAEIHAMIIDGRAGLKKWIEAIRSLNKIIPIVAVASSADWAERECMAKIEQVTILQPGQADLVEQTLSAIERFRALPRIAAVTTQESLRQKLLRCFGSNVVSYPTAPALWVSLEEEMPDVFVLDLQGCHALETLALALRQDARTARAAIVAVAARESQVNSSFDEALSPNQEDTVLQSKILSRFRRSLGVRRLIDTDPMTGLANRRRARARVSFLVRLGTRQRVNLSVAILDLDHFKSINDTYGHGVGDRVIRRLARLLRHSFRLEDVTARMGGEEFLVASYGIGAQILAERLRQVLGSFYGREFRAPRMTPFRVTFSGGVAEMGRDGPDFQTLYDAADRALYQAKEKGRNQIIIAVPENHRPLT